MEETDQHTRDEPEFNKKDGQTCAEDTTTLDNPLSGRTEPESSGDLDYEHRKAIVMDPEFAATQEAAAIREEAEESRGPDFVPSPLVKRLYATGDKECSCGTRWSEYADPTVEERQLKLQSAKYDIVHRQRRVKNVDNAGKLWETDSVVVRGTTKQFLVAGPLNGYTGINLNASELKFYPPFEPIIHRWPSFSKLRSQTNMMSLVAPFIDIFQPDIEPNLALIDEISSSGKIRWNDIWLILAPGELFRSYEKGAPAVYRLLECEMIKREVEPDYWWLQMEFVDWNGNHCGHATTTFRIKEYKGRRDVASLEVHPFHTGPGSTGNDQERAELIERGRAFEKLRGYHFKACYGTRMFHEIDNWGNHQTLEKPVRAKKILLPLVCD